MTAFNLQNRSRIPEWSVSQVSSGLFLDRNEARKEQEGVLVERLTTVANWKQNIMEDANDKGKALQTRLYYILEKLQVMAKEVPVQYQQRISSELLSGLANTLLHNTIFEIVKGLKEIQDVTERQMFHNRIRLMEKLRLEKNHLASKHKKSRPEVYQKELERLAKKHRHYRKAFDMKIVLHLDQKVSEQQAMMEKAGVPGFYVTVNRPEIKVQMLLLDFILRLSAMPIPHVAFDDED